MCSTKCPERFTTSAHQKRQETGCDFRLQPVAVDCREVSVIDRSEKNGEGTLNEGHSLTDKGSEGDGGGGAAGGREQLCGAGSCVNNGPPSSGAVSGPRGAALPSRRAPSLNSCNKCQTRPPPHLRVLVMVYIRIRTRLSLLVEPWQCYHRHLWQRACPHVLVLFIVWLLCFV